MSSPGYRIAMVAACPYPVPQGSQVLIRDTARLLRDRGHDVHLFTYGHGLGACPAGLNLRRSPSVRGASRTKAGPSLAKPMQDYRLLQTLSTALRNECFDCVYAHNYEGLAVALAAGHRPIVYHAHNAMADELPYFVTVSAIPRALGGLLDRSLPRRADAVITPHERLAEYLIQSGCQRERIRVIPPSVDAPMNPDPQPALGLASILYTGNLDSYQNLPLLESAVAIARECEPKLEWLVATSEEHCRLRGATYVHTPDYHSMLEVLLRDAVVACPRVSWSGYPIKLLNAMAAGRAVVACTNSAYPIEDGVNGVVVPDGDVAAFGETLLAVATDCEMRTRLGRAAWETMRDDHNAATVGSNIEAAIVCAIQASNAAASERVVSSL